MSLKVLRRKLKREHPHIWLLLWSKAAPATFIFLVLGVLFFVMLFFWYAKDLPSPSSVRKLDKVATIIYDRNGEVLYDVYQDVNRIPVKLEELPDEIKNATVAIEDKNFYQHRGFDPLAIFRSLRTIILERRLAGGSTLTQQLVKNVLLTPERTLTRKIKELILSIQIENRFSKDEILQMYLNNAPYGGPAVGIEAAAQTYFGKHAKDLSLVEAAVLAGLPQRPTTYSPFGPQKDVYKKRTLDVLRRMREDGYISSQQEETALQELKILTMTATTQSLKAPHFVFYIRQLLAETYGEQMVETGGLRVTTTLDWSLQEKAQEIVSAEIEKIEKYNATNGGAVVLDPQTGQILAMVGSKDFFAEDYDGQVNVTLAERQPGSAAKPFVYASLLENKISTAASLWFDLPLEFETGNPEKPLYKPQNYDGKFRGLLQTRFTLGNSINVPAVEAVAVVGVHPIMELGYKMGITTWQPSTKNLAQVGLSLALGGREVRLLDLTSAFGVILNRGVRHEPVAILKVEDLNGRVLEEYKESKGRRVLSEEVSFILSHILSDNNARLDVFGPNSLLNIPGKTVSVKTGTTDEKRDNWTVGGTPSRLIGVWVGNNDNSPMHPTIISGVTGATPIWHLITRLALKNLAEEILKPPENVVAVEIDAFLGGLARHDSPKRTEYFLKGTEPAGPSPFYQKLKISQAHPDKLANQGEIATDQFEEREFIVFSPENLSSGLIEALGGWPKFQEFLRDFISKHHQDDPRFHPPTETSDFGEERLTVKILKPDNLQRLEQNEIEIEAAAFSPKEITRLKIEIDGLLIEERALERYKIKVTLENGPHTIRATAVDSDGNESVEEIKIGVRSDWDKKIPPSPSPASSL